MKNDATSLIHMDANATVGHITIVCHLFSTMSILLRFELDSNPGRKGALCVLGRGGGYLRHGYIYEVIENTTE